MSELPAGWVEVPIGEVCEVVGGATPKTKVQDNWGGDIAWITPDDLSKHEGQYISQGARSLTEVGYDSCSARLMPAGTVLFTSRAPIGYVAIADAPVCTNQGFKSFVPPNGLLSEYLYWYLRHMTPTIQGMGSGTTFKEVSKAVASAVPLRFPPLAEQRRIVEAIEEHFTRIDAAEATLSTALGRIDWLLQALITRAIPTDAEHCSLDEVLKAPLANGRSVRSRDGGFPVLRLTAIKDRRIDPLQSKEGDWEADGAKSFLVEEGDFLVSRGNGSLKLVGRGGLVDQVPSEGVAFPDTMIRIRTAPERLTPRYLSLVWDSPAVRRQIEGHAHTTAGIYKVNQEMLRGVSIPVVDVAQQRELIEEFDEARISLEAVRAGASAALTLASSLRLSVLSQAFSGRLVAQRSSDYVHAPSVA